MRTCLGVSGEWQEKATSFWKKYRPAVLAKLRKKWPGHPDVEDAAAMAFDKFLRTGMDAFDPTKKSLAGYLLLIAERELISQHRKDDSREQREQQYLEQKGARGQTYALGNPEVRELTDENALQSTHPKVVQFLATLEGNNQQIFQLDVDGNSVDVIAQAIQLPLDVVYVRRSKLRKLFDAFLQQ